MIWAFVYRALNTCRLYFGIHRSFSLKTKLVDILPDLFDWEFTLFIRVRLALTLRGRLALRLKIRESLAELRLLYNRGRYCNILGYATDWSERGICIQYRRIINSTFDVFVRDPYDAIYSWFIICLLVEAFEKGWEVGILARFRLLVITLSVLPAITLLVTLIKLDVLALYHHNLFGLGLPDFHHFSFLAF
jgi:hypothetical protein